VADIVLAVPPTPGGGLPTVSLSETPCALESYQLTFEINNVSVTFQGTYEALAAHFGAAHQMLQDFAAPPSGRQFAGGYDLLTRRWNER
jgi:hypothetical protein